MSLCCCFNRPACNRDYVQWSFSNLCPLPGAASVSLHDRAGGQEGGSSLNGAASSESSSLESTEEGRAGGIELTGHL